MPIELDEFYKEFFQEVLGSADAEGRYSEDAFFEYFRERLIAAGELDAVDRAQYLAPKGIRIDGYGGDPYVNVGVLSLIIADFSQSQEIATLTASEMEAIFKRAVNFLTKSLDASFRESLEETNPGFGLADLISNRWPIIEKIRLFLISNRLLSSRIDGREAGDFKGIPLIYSVWDLGRLHRFETSGHGREDIEIDLVNDFGGPLIALPAHLNEADYEAYLVVVPGKQLAAIYDRWGARLLEQNVRVFLQARGNVNKGIRITIENDPEMFFAYNNGITATAESIETQISDGKLLLTGFKNLQIVNGGQTTASIHAASKKKEVDLSKVFVQMKLSIIDLSRTEEVVPKISEYANTQNRVNAADFFANHPFHVRMEKFSRRIFAPSPDGTFRESKWFYERARGQYNDARANLTMAQRKKFELEYPKRQVFSKTDLAKFIYVWRGHPDIVSKGAQKNFADFAKTIGKEWLDNPDSFNEVFYHDVISMAIVFHTVEKLVTEQTWYQGGYRANIVAYAIAKLAVDFKKLGRSVDFESIWKKQGITKSIEEALIISARMVHEILINPPAGMRNVTEWAKQQACWNRVMELKIEWPKQLLESLLSEEEQKEIKKAAKKDQRLYNSVETQIAIVNAGGDFWRSIREWGEKERLLSEKEAEILKVAVSIPDLVPNEIQCQKIIEIYNRLRKKGCPIEMPYRAD